MKDFYEITFDSEGCPDMWHLRHPIDEHGNIMDANLLPRMGPYVGPRIDRVQIDTRYPGRPLDFSFGYFNFLTVRTHVADLIEQHGGRIQRYPVTLEPTGESGYEVIFTLDAPKGLIDLNRAEEYEFYTESDEELDLRYGGIPPRQRGMLYKLSPFYLVSEKVPGLVIFRPWEEGKLIISGDLKRAFERAGVIGIEYRPVS